MTDTPEHNRRAATRRAASGVTVHSMSAELGAWLRAQRRARGWDVPEMARQLARAAGPARDGLPGKQCLFTYIRRWEKGWVGVSERYRLLFCRAFGIGLADFGRVPAGEPAPAARGAAAGPHSAVGEAGQPFPLGPGPLPGSVTRLLPAAGIAYRRIEMPDVGDFGVEQAVVMAAHEGGEQAERAERRDIGDATLEQMRADVMRLSRAYMTGAPFPLFLEMRRVRSRIYAALDRRLWPRDATELYFMLGCLNGLMAIAAKALGYPHASDELVRAGWAYAVAIGHRPLMGRLRLESSDVAYWDGRPRQARDLAASGLDYLSAGPNAALLHLQYAGAAARLGDAGAARAAIAAGSEAREREHHDDLLEIGGEFNFSRASQHYYAGRTMVELPEGEAEAVTELERAAELYAAGPEPGEDHSHACEMLARTDLATARLRAGQLDAAIAALEPVLALPPENRTDLLSQRLLAVRAELARPRYHGSPQARQTDERIEEFSRDTIVVGLHTLPAVPG